MSITVVAPSRLFKIGCLTLPDPDPSMSPEDAVQLFSNTYPQVIDCLLSKPVVSPDGDLIYTVERAPAKTKG